MNRCEEFYPKKMPQTPRLQIQQFPSLVIEVKLHWGIFNLVLTFFTNTSIIGYASDCFLSYYYNAFMNNASLQGSYCYKVLTIDLVFLHFFSCMLPLFMCWFYNSCVSYCTLAESAFKATSSLQNFCLHKIRTKKIT